MAQKSLLVGSCTVTAWYGSDQCIIWHFRATLTHLAEGHRVPHLSDGNAEYVTQIVFQAQLHIDPTEDTCITADRSDYTPMLNIPVSCIRSYKPNHVSLLRP